MASISVRPEYRLEGTSNFNTWKARILTILEEHDLDGYVSSVVEELTTNVGHIDFKKNKYKAKRNIYDSAKENLMLVIAPLKTTKEFFDILTHLYEKKDPSQKRAMKNKLHNLNMEKDETMNSFFTNISQVRDQLLSIGVTIDDDDLI